MSKYDSDHSVNDMPKTCSEIHEEHGAVPVIPVKYSAHTFKTTYRSAIYLLFYHTAIITKLFLSFFFAVASTCKIKTKSNNKLGNFSFWWTKILYQNNVKYIKIFFCVV